MRIARVLLVWGLLSGVGNAQVVDHTTLPQFDALTDAQIAGAAARPVLFVNRSVGFNLSTGLDALAAADPRFSRAAIEFRGWPNVMPAPNLAGCAGWNGLWTGYGACATSWFTAHPGPEIVTFWHDYLTGLWAPNPVANYFGPTTRNQFRACDWLAWQAAHPEVQAFSWTTSLPYSDGSTPGLLARLDAYNVLARAWAVTPGRPLLDAADILSHDADGVNCVDPVSGKPRICQAWAADWAQGGGHLTVAGQARMARAFWLMLVVLGD